MKKLVISFIALFTIGGMYAQQGFIYEPAEKKSVLNVHNDTKESTYTFSYCLNESTGQVGTNSGAALKTGIAIPAETASKFAGNKVVKVRFCLGTGLPRNSTVFISNNKTDATPVYTQAFTAVREAWNEVELETPYEITDNAFFVGYSMTMSASNRIIGMDSEVNNPNGDWIATGDEWIHCSEAGIQGNISLQLVLEGDNFPQNDLVLKDVSTDKGFIKPGEEFAISFALKNEGLLTTENFEVSYQVGENAPVEGIKIEDAAIVNNGMMSFTLDNIAVGTQTGTLPVKLSVSNPNGVMDEYPENNEMEINVVCSNNIFPRKIMLENFTTMRCVNCPAAHTLIKNVLSTREDVVWIAHHSGYYTDQFTITESEQYMWFYNAGGSVYAPAMMLDRTNLNDKGTTSGDNTPIFNPNAHTVATLGNIIDWQLTYPAFVTIDLGKSYDKETRTLTLDITAGQIEDFDLGSNPRLNVFLTEDNLWATQTGASGQYRHDHVMRKVLSSTWGDAITFEDGSFTKSYSFDIPATWDEEYVTVIAFVANYDSADQNNCVVYNTEFTALTSEESGVIANNPVNDINIYSVGNTVYIGNEYQTATIYDFTGKIVKRLYNNQKSFDLVNGIYLINVDGKTSKFIVR